MYNYEASFFVWLTEPLYLTKFQKAAICVRDFQGVRDTTLTLLGTAGRFGRPAVRIGRPFGIMFENFFRHDPVTSSAASPRLRAYHMFNLRTKE